MGMLIELWPAVESKSLHTLRRSCDDGLLPVLSRADTTMRAWVWSTGTVGTCERGRACARGHGAATLVTH